MASPFPCLSSRRLESTDCTIFFICSSFFFFFLSLSESMHFEISSFGADTPKIVYSGDAQPSSGAIELNVVTDRYRVGHATYTDAVQIWDRKSGNLTDFNTHFTFVVDTLGQSVYGDSFAFFLAPVGFQIPPNSAGGCLGLFNTTGSPGYQMVFAEFDSFGNTWDPPSGHVGINFNSVRSVKTAAWNASLHSEDPADAWVSYNASTQMLSVSWRYSQNQSISQQEDTNIISYHVDLREALPEWVTVGFSGATGAYVQRNVLQYWEFDSSLNIVEKGDEIPKKTTKGAEISKNTKIAITVPIGITVIGAGIVAYAIFRRRQRNPTEKSSLDTVALTTSINDDFERGAGPKRFSLSELTLATNNFSDDRKLGQGGFGCVYKGYLSRDDMAVAVKKISQGSKQGKKEYITEVKTISSLRHRHLVQLIGWCHEQTQFLLVYEFLPNGSLDSHLFNAQPRPLKWALRYKIATGLASALLYLHEECEQCVVHRDIKASNIMLDIGFNAKLGDFGLARVMDHEVVPQTTGVAGTLGYMAPEYMSTGKASKESDVYSFGVVVLEIACGRKVRDIRDRVLGQNSDKGLVQWVWDLFGKGQLLSCVDQMMKMEFVDEKEVECLMMVGLWCAHPDRNLRPSIRQAIQVLKFEAALPNLPVKMPVAMYSAGPDAPEVGFSGGTMTNSSIDLVR